MRPILCLSGVLASIVLLCGCTSMRVDHASDPNADFSTFRTFDWRSTPDHMDDPLIDDPDLVFELRSQIRDALEAKGYRKVDRRPDFTIVTHVALRTRLTRAAIDRWGYRYPPYRRPGRAVWFVAVDSYDVGTLVIDVIDTRSNDLVWRGVATDAVSTSARGRREQIEEAVRRILAPFPSR